MKNFISILIVTGLIGLVSCKSSGSKSEAPAKKYTADWESLAKVNEQPDWFQDAKLGIYFHWGVYSVPAFGTEWYPRWMHFKGRPEYDYHVKTYGDPVVFGYHDFVPMFTAEHFDAEEWAELFRKAGARFAGPVAEHHDGFSMWDSDITPWNAMDKGPHKDILGEMAAALRKRDIKLITTFHHARNLQRHDTATYERMGVLGDIEVNTSWASHYPFFEGMAPTSDDPELKYLYGNIPEEQWLEEVWLGKIEEVIDKYDPDIIWFDSWLDSIPESYRKEMAAYYYNHANDEGKEVVIVRKQMDLPLDMSVDDLEKSRKNELEEKVWMTDETISMGSWCYTQDLKIKPAIDVLHVLIDITSKNGVLLLNISPMSNGIIPDDQQAVLLEMGDWLGKYGEAIYETRPWYTFGEGPTKEPRGHYENSNEFLKIKYSDKDIRYTTKGKTVYAIQLGVPRAGSKFLLNSFSVSNLPAAVKISDVTLLGPGTHIDWTLEGRGLILEAPAKAPDNKALVYRIDLI